MNFKKKENNPSKKVYNIIKQQNISKNNFYPHNIATKDKAASGMTEWGGWQIWSPKRKRNSRTNPSNQPCQYYGKQVKAKEIKIVKYNGGMRLIF